MQDVQRVAAYGLLADDAGRVVLVRASDRSDLQGQWFLPGGGVDFGEHPQDAVVREVAEEIGVDVRATGVRDVVCDVVDLPHRGLRVHTIRVLYDLAAVAAGWERTMRPEPDGTSDAVRLVAPDDELPVMPFVARTLDRPVPPTPEAHPPARPAPARPWTPPHVAGAFGHPVPYSRGTGGRRVLGGADEGLALPAHADLDALHDEAVAQVQRPAAYALCHDAGRVLLTRLRDSDLWILPGGGIDHGEQARDAAVREVHEETGLPVTLTGLLDVDSIRFTGHGPGGRVEDFHGIRVIYAGRVPTDVAPTVTEVDGSTEEAAWYPLADARQLRLAGLVLAALGHLR